MQDIDPTRLKAFLSDPIVSKDKKDKVAAMLRARKPLSEVMPAPAPEAQSPMLEAFHRPEATPEERERFTANVLPTAGRIGGAALRVGGALLGGRLGGRLGMAGGSAVGDIAAQGLERVTGARQAINPRETVAQGVLGAAAPALSGGVAAGAVKGGLYGLGSVTLDSLAKGEGVPGVGQLALGTVVGGLLTGGGRRLFRPAINELSHADVAEPTAKILSGEFIKDASPAEHEAIRDFKSQLKLPGVRYRVATGEPSQTYRTRAGRFETRESASVKQRFDLESRAAELEPARSAEQGELALTREIEKPRGTFKRKSGAYIGIMKSWFDKAERRTGLRVYSDAYEPIEQANVRRIELNSSRAEDAKQIYKGTKAVQQEKYQAFLEHPDKAKAQELLKLDLGDKIRTDKLHDTWKRNFRAFGLGDDIEPFFTKYMPMLRKAGRELGPDARPEDVVKKAFPVGVPKEVDFFRELLESEGAGFNDTNSLGILARYTNYGSWKTIVESHVSAARRAFVNNPDVPSGIKETLNHYFEQAHGGRDRAGRDLADWISDFASRTPGLRRMGLDRATVKDMTSAFVTLPYAGTLGFRPGPLIRNAMQTIMTGYSELGARWLAVGWKQALSPKGQELARRLGILAGQPSFTGEFAAGLQGPTTSKLGSLVRGQVKLTTRSLGPYSSVDELNRVAMGLGQYARASRAMRKAGGNVARFLDYAWINSGSFHPTEQKVLSDLAMSGRMQEASRRSAIAMADNTQWVMRGGNRPPVTTSTAGRFFAQYYSWGAFYANYLRRLIPATQGQRLKDSIRAARFLGATTAMAGGASYLGHKAHIEDAGRRALMWLGPSPMIYTGAPGLELTLQAGRAAEELASGGGLGGPAQKELGREAESFIPFGGLAKDFQHLLKPDKGQGEAVLRTLGVQPRVPKLFR